MTVESAKAFYKRIDVDEAFRTQFQNATSNDERQMLVQNAGYNFTPEEWEAAITEISASDNQELSDAELAAVNGGSIPIDWIKWPPIKWPPFGGRLQPMYGIVVNPNL